MQKVKKIIFENNENINKEIKNLKGNQKEIMRLKSTITEIKKYTRGFKISSRHMKESVNSKIKQ